MRAGGCTLQQALTLEAAAVVKQAVGLARRRGHAQVTPLHVASTMLAASTGLFRAACLQSHSHPLQCKALELCFNVALNRLPASSSSGPLLGPGGGYGHGHHHHHGQPPSLSNALVAAFKRAQAHQRRGSIESQQQPLLAVKIEVEQLIVSILDDPSVSRVMREAGFSSTQVKANVEQVLQAENPNPGNSSSSTPDKTSPSSNNQQPDQQSGGLQTPPTLIACNHPVRTHQRQPYKQEDVTSVVECMVGSSSAGSRRFLAAKRSVVVVGECLASAEDVVRGVMDQAEKGEAAPLHGVQFISLPLFSFTRLDKEEVDRKVAELRCFIKSCCCFPGKGGLVLYLGDLRWAAEYRASSSCIGRGGMSNGYYCPVEHVIFEISRMLAAFGSAAAAATAVDGNQIDHCGGAGRFWVMGVATYQTYMRCKVGTPSLDTLWGLHPVAVPSGSLDLSLSCDSDLQIPLRSQGKDQSKDRNNGSIYSSTCSLPSWLLKYKEAKKLDGTNYKQQDNSSDSRDFPTKYWSPTCTSSEDQYTQQTRTLNLSLVSSSLPSISVSYEYNYHQKAKRPTTVTKENHVWIPNPKSISNNRDGSVSTSSSSETMAAAQAATAPCCRRYKELSAENLKTLCAALEEKVPWQANIVPEIASTLLQCRSGMKRRKSRQQMSTACNAVLKEDTWLLFQGCDADGKLRVARELAALVFGSHTRLCSIRLGAAGKLSAESSGDEDGDEEERSSKRSRTSGDHTPTVHGRDGGCLQRFAEAVAEDPHRVFLLHDIEQWDCGAQAGIKVAIEHGKIRHNAGGQASLEDAIVVLICEGFDARSRAGSPPAIKHAEDEYHGSSSLATLDLNALAGDEGDNSVGGDIFDDGGRGLMEAVDSAFFFGMNDF